MGGTITPSRPRSEPPIEASPDRACVEVLENLASAPGDASAGALAHTLEQLNALAPTGKLRARAVAATREILEHFELKRLDAWHLGALLQALSPAYLADGTRPTLLPFLGRVLPSEKRWSAQMDASAAAGVLRGLASLPLDEATKLRAADLLRAWAQRLKELIPSMGADEVAGAVLGLRLARGADRELMLELLGGLLRRAIETDGWTPRAAAGLCRGLLAVKADPTRLELARDVLGAVLPAIVPHAGQLMAEQSCDVLASLALVSPLPSASTGPLLAVLLPHLQRLTSHLHPFEIATVLRSLGQLELDESTAALASATAQRLVVSQRVDDLVPTEAARMLLGMHRLAHDATGKAIAAAFAMAVADLIPAAATTLSAGELADVLGLLADLPLDEDGKVRARALALQLLPAVERRASKVGPEERGGILNTIDLLEVPLREAAHRDMVASWRTAAPPAALPGTDDIHHVTPARAEREEDPLEDTTLTAAAVMKELGISRPEIYRRLRILGLDSPGRAGYTRDLVEQLRAAPALEAPSPGSAPPSPAPPPANGDSPSTRRISLSKAANELEIGRAALVKWLRDEPELQGKAVKEGRRIWFDSALLPLLRTVHQRRMASAPESLRKAWAARRAGAHNKEVVAKGPRKSRKPAPEMPPKVKTLTGAQAARQLGVRRPTLYALLRRHAIKPPGRRQGFSPEMVEQLRARLFPAGSPAPTTTRALSTTSVPTTTTAAPAPPPALVPISGSQDPMLRMVAAMERIAADFASTVRGFLEHERELLGQQRLLIDQQRLILDRMRPTTIRVRMDEESETPPSRSPTGVKPRRRIVK